jgi:hypothetical protein
MNQIEVQYEVYYAKQSSCINGVPLLQLDVSDVYYRKGLARTLAHYGDVCHLFEIHRNGFTQIYGGTWNDEYDSQIKQIQQQM